MSFNSLLNKLVTIQTRTVAYSATGAATKTYSNKATNVKCAIQPNTGKLATSESSEKLNITHLGFFLIGTSIIAGDKVIDADSNEYAVVRVFAAAGRGRHLEAGLELQALP